MRYGVCVPGRGADGFSAARGQLGAGPHAGGRIGGDGVAHGVDRATAANRGLVHHSDRGVQYASQDYTQMLKRHHATISMSRKEIHTITRPANTFMQNAEIRGGLPLTNTAISTTRAPVSVSSLSMCLIINSDCTRPFGYVPPWPSSETGAAL